MKYKVIALDIDGTLTNTDKVMTPETVKAVIDLQKEGLPQMYYQAHHIYQLS